MALETSFSAFLSESKNGLNTSEKILAMVLFMESMDRLEVVSESKLEEDLIVIAEGINDHLNKVGFKIHKSKGILDYIKNFTTGIGKVMFHIIKGDTDKAKELIKKISKEDVLDFLYKLDLGTLHLFTGPLHMIDAWTGWDLAVNLKSHIDKSQGVVDLLKQAIDKVKKGIIELFSSDNSRQNELMGYVSKLEQEALA